MRKQRRNNDKKYFYRRFIYGANGGKIQEYEELKEFIISNFKDIEVITPHDIDIFRDNYKKEHSNADFKECNRAMVEYDLQAVQNCDLMIANVSKRSLGLGIEIGTLLSKVDRRILFVAEDGASVTNMIDGAYNEPIHYYKNMDELKKLVYDYIARS